ncbi:cation:proton antiporter [uncultured Desulfovibrio sp.]|uniref:cation:proton antiporter domain-containing protein n=1 Tax=uncultured Desulfovibrio sp. TaxID=167968 RepID=UPI00039F4E1C|nr:cation:proton antiporter [uncultured Desulfovibrio sp.]
MEVPFLYEIVIIFLLSIVVTIVCNRLKLPATVGFLLTGVLCGPSLLGIVSNREAIDQVADIGVAMLLFTIGMELSGDALSRLKRLVFLGGSLQIGLTVLAVTGLAVLEGISYQKGIFWGCLVALSSSAIVLRILQERGSSNTPTGRLSLAILVFQDIMVAPMLLCVPLLAGTLNLSLEAALFSVLWVALALGGVLLFARFGLDRLMEAVMRTRTREILLLTTLGLCMGTALLTSALGLSLSLGAFLAGLLLARSQYSMSVISGILPYRDVFMSLFFISVGMMLNVDFFGQHFFSIILSTLLFIAIKSLLTLPAVLIQGYPLRAAIITSLSLAQVGEFAFVLAASGLEAGLFDMTAYQNFLAVSVFTMMLTPGLIAIAPRLANRIAGWRNEKQLEDAKESGSESCPLEDHLIIVGFGISGKHLAHVAHESGISYTILEMNPETVHRYHGKEPIFHGDATQPVVLEHLGVEKARVLAIIISDPAAVRAITIEARRLNPNLYIVARTRFVTEVAPLRRLGANDVIAEEFETSIEVFSRVLTQYLVPRQDIDAFAAHIRQMNYRMIRRMSNAVDPLDEVVSRLPDMGVQAMRLGADSPLCGLPLSRSDLRPKYGVTVVAIHRQGEIHASPEPQSCLEADDIIYLFGRTDKLYAVKPLFSDSLKENAAPSKSAEASI